MKFNVREVSEVASSACGELWVDFVRMHPTGAANKFCKQCGVIARARTDMQDHIAFLWRKPIEAASVQAWLADVDAALCVKRDECVLIQEGWIITRRLHIGGAFARLERPGTDCQYGPGSRSREGFARHLRKRPLNSAVSSTAHRRDELRIKCAEVNATVGHEPAPLAFTSAHIDTIRGFPSKRTGKQKLDLADHQRRAKDLAGTSKCTVSKICKVAMIG